MPENPYEDISKDQAKEAIVAARKAKISQAQLYRNTFDSETGKKLLWELEKAFGPDLENGMCAIDKNGRVDTAGTMFNNGCNHVLNHITKMIDMAKNPQKYLL